MRKTTDLPAPASTVRRKAHEDTTRTYRFLTPVFGGGVRVEAHEKPRDAVTPVRGASIRGQLRFWWRAMNPQACETVETLREAERAVWGSTDLASPVVVQVVRQPAAAQDLEVFYYNDKRRLVFRHNCREIAYGAFPLQPKKELQPAQTPGVLHDYREATFELRFLYKAGFAPDVEAALWAWEHFGGLGGRTRRGFGAIACKERQGESLDPIEARLRDLASRPRIPGVPSLAGARLAFGKRSHAQARDAWSEALGTLQRLRQGENVGRNPSSRFANRPGRSRWPEPDEIRRLTGLSAPMHRTPTVEVQRFPRAAFGMPIVFHFQNGPRDPEGQRDPDMTPLELRPVESERFASPLVLRPFAAANGYRAGVLVLESAVPAAQLVAGRLAGSPFPVQHQLTAADAAGIPVLRLNGSVFTDPLARFLEEFKR